MIALSIHGNGKLNYPDSLLNEKQDRRFTQRYTSGR